MTHLKQTALLRILPIVAAALVSACEHNVSGVVTARISDPGTPTAATVSERGQIATQTCQVQYARQKQNYLSAVETVVARDKQGLAVSRAPLENFRAEINAAYNAVVSRCKTHTHCLDVQRYDEARCYMSASDRKDAERRFSDLSKDLRRMERDYETRVARAKSKKPATNVRVETNVRQQSDQQQKSKQNQNNHNGDYVEDQDVLAICDRADGLLDRKCMFQ